MSQCREDSSGFSQRSAAPTQMRTMPPTCCRLPYLGSRESRRLLRGTCHTASRLFQADIRTGQFQGHRALDKIQSLNTSKLRERADQTQACVREYIGRVLDRSPQTGGQNDTKSSSRFTSLIEPSLSFPSLTWG